MKKLIAVHTVRVFVGLQRCDIAPGNPLPADVEPAAIDGLLGTQCPNILFPYVRQLLSDLIQAGGFPPFFLQPINFDGLYMETVRQRAAQAEAGGELANAEPVGNA